MPPGASWRPRAWQSAQGRRSGRRHFGVGVGHQLGQPVGGFGVLALADRIDHPDQQPPLEPAHGVAQASSTDGSGSLQSEPGIVSEFLVAEHRGQRRHGVLAANHGQTLARLALSNTGESDLSTAISMAASSCLARSSAARVPPDRTARPMRRAPRSPTSRISCETSSLSPGQTLCELAPLRETYASPNVVPFLRVSQIRHGSRMARLRIRLACSSPTNSSLVGSKVSLRPSCHEM